jgi:membrane-associated protease RseP (regulator of RpoE activity)
MRPMSIDTLLVRGSIAALLVVGAVQPGRAQVVVAPRSSKDTVVVKMFTSRGDSVRVVRITTDSIRDLMRAWEIEPLFSLQSARMSRELEALAAKIRTTMGGGGPGILITAGPDGINQFGPGMARGWIGITTGGVHNEWADGKFLQYLDYPPILTVERKSPAQIAGIVPGDTLVAYDGQDVVAHPINVTQLLTPDKRVAVTVRRDGEDKAFTITVGRAPNAVFLRRAWEGEGPFPPDGPIMAAGGVGAGARATKHLELRAGPPMSGQIFAFRTGVFGADVSNVGPDLAKALRIEPGVLVNEVPEDTPAFRMGLRAGDVIVSVAGQPVTRIDDVRTLAALRGDNRPLELQIIRDKKPRTITVK